jgi:uncharacterized membrane protein YidH (DUF202 family)
MLVSGVLALSGYQLVIFAAFIKIFGMRAGFLPLDRRMESFFRVATLEKGLLLGAILALTGLALVLLAVVSWSRSGYRPLDAEATKNPLIVAVVLTAGGVQTLVAIVVMSMLGIQHNIVMPSPVVLEPDRGTKGVAALG